MTKTKLFAAILLIALCGQSLAQVTSCPGFRTQTQGGWSSTPNGNNPGTYLNNKFATAFPTGLEIGCTNKLRLTSASAVRAFLPQTATPTALPAGTRTNPTKSNYKNVFAGQLVTLALNLRFDEYDANFGASAGRLRDLYIARGPFMGWTVGQLFDQANRKIGGCSAPAFSFSDYNNAVDMVNRNYDNGAVTGNYLACELKISGIKGDVSCFGGSNGSIDLTIVDGVPPYSVLWSNGATTEDLSGLSAGVYSVVVTDAIGQSKSLSFTIGQPSQLILSSVKSNVSCFGGSNGSLTISASGGTPPYTGLVSLSGLSAGSYSYIVSDANGCSASITVQIQEPSLLVAAHSQSNVNCFGGSDGSVVVSASGGTPPYNGFGTFGGLSAGTYSYLVTDFNGCTSSVSVQITQPELLVLSGSSTPSSTCGPANCDGTASVQVSGGVGPYSYSWSNGLITEGGVLEGLCGTEEFSVLVSDANGCTATWDFLGIECQDNGCDTLRTYTIGGWGAQPNGNNPGVYLHANFAGAFPNGITIGCDNTLTLTTAQMVTDWLPSGSTPSFLPAGNMVNDMSYNNVLAAQLMGVTLAVGFDAYDADFASSEDFLGDRYVNVAPFEGMTVSQLLALANQAIGGCGSSYSASQFNAALTAINENYDNGNMDNGDLSCTPTYASVKFAATGSISNIYPNPADAQASVALQLGEQTMVQIDVMDMAGRIVYTSSFMAEKGSNNLELNTKSLEEQVYLVRVTAGQKTEVKSFAVFH